MQKPEKPINEGFISAKNPPEILNISLRKMFNFPWDQDFWPEIGVRTKG